MTKIKAVEMVRRIRDELYENTRDKSKEEFKAFIQQEAASANAKIWRQKQEQQQLSK
jgi:hypothetical protein